MQLIDQPWQQSLSPSKTKQLLYNCSNPLIWTLAYLPLAAQFDFFYNFFKPTLWLKSVRVRNMQEKRKRKKRDRWWHARSEKGEPLPKAALANQSPGWCAMIWYALPFPFTEREDDDALPSQEKRPNAPKNCSKKIQTPAYNFATNSWSDLRVVVTIKATFSRWNSSPRNSEEIYH